MKEFIALTVIILLILPIFSISGYVEKNDLPIYDTCYGFIVPLPSGNDSTCETFLNTKVRNLINDLLRENITVYWSSNEFLAPSKEINNNSNGHDFYFNKGDFTIS